jgi:hypothetical protein
MRMGHRFLWGTARRTSAARVGSSMNGPTARRSCWLSGMTPWTVVCLAPNPFSKPTGSSASGWRLSLPGRGFAFSWSPSCLPLATTPPVDYLSSLSDPGSLTTRGSGLWTKSHTSTSWRAPGCLSGVSRSEAPRTGQSGFSGSGERSTQPCLPFSTSCWTKWRCHSSSRLTNTASLGGTIFMKIASGTTFSKWW